MAELARLFYLFTICALLTGCPPSPGGPPPAPTTASLSISTKDYVSGGAGIQCTATVQWHFEPIALTGSQGKDAAFSVTQSYSGTSSQIEMSGAYPVYGCIHNDSQIGLKAGTWKIRATNGVWGAECQKQISNSGFNTAQFTINRAGCQ